MQLHRIRSSTRLQWLSITYQGRRGINSSGHERSTVRGTQSTVDLYEMNGHTYLCIKTAESTKLIIEKARLYKIATLVITLYWLRYFNAIISNRLEDFENLLFTDSLNFWIFWSFKIINTINFRIELNATKRNFLLVKIFAYLLKNSLKILHLIF